MKMAEESSGLGMSHSLEKKKRDILLSTKRTWLPLDEQQPPAPREEGWHSPIPEIENSRQESIQQWLDSGFFITAQGNLQPAIDQTDSLNKQGVDPETVQDYMRSLQQFSETPALSRGTSFNSCPSVPSIPKSIPEWLEFWQKDPVEILLDLGFGAEEPDICTKIPARFLRGSSAAKGINIREFLEAHKQRMDLETPNLYGRFRQLEVLDHVTNAFSSLLNNVNSLQREGEGNAQAENPKLAQVRVNQDRRKRLGQLLRRASKQTVRRDCVQGRAETLRVKEDLLPTPGEPDKCPSLQSSRMNVADHSHLSPLTEEQPPVASNKLASHEASPSAPGKSGPPLSSMAFKKPALPCTPEGSARDRGFQEKGPLLSHRLRQVVHMDGKSPDSFEMEEVQSFEEEPGNPLEGTLGTVGAGVTRASSCQSDSSGFLEEPSEPFPLQSTVQNVEIWRTVCQSFREHSEEIGRHLTKQQAYVFSDMSEEGREEMRQLHNLRQDLQQQVAELEFQLSDRARQIREGMLLQFDQLLEEQSQLCSELGLTDWGEGSEPNFHTDLDIHETVSPRAPSPTIEGQGTPLPEQTRTCALSSPTSEGSPEMALPSPTLAEPDLTASSASWDQRVSGEEKRGFNQSRMDLKGFLCKMKKTFKSSFGNEAADGQN
ncbi:protein ITPRID1 isoform X6 [Dromiciops gliroides]|uniref:protein ITPRID1 isoform X6 n=1 Tax=Dromiciops gliroides TaxID=33562 RepID=UPI001CC3368C|nr:protein ITPRID1 isoform X6 [Dromiciops gliroides]